MKGKKMKTRILHYVSKMNRGGQETFIMNVFRSIDRGQVGLDFLCTESGEGDYDKEIKKMGGSIYNLPPLENKHFKMFALLYSLWIELKRLSKNHDIFEIHTQHAMDAFLSSIVAKKAGFKTVIVHSHNTNTLYHRKLHFVFRPLLQMINIKRFACGEEAGKWMFGTSKFLIINNGINIREFTFSQQQRNVVRRENHLENTVVIGHVGRFNKQKNQAFIIKVFQEFLKLHPKSKLLFIGAGEDKPQIEDMVKQSSLENKVEFCGARNDVNKLYQAMDLFILPSFFEGLPVVLVEAQASSLPCLVSDSVTREVEVTDRIEFLSLKEDASVWANKLNELLVKFNNRKDEILAIRKHGYDIHDVSKKLEKLYIQYNGE